MEEAVLVVPARSDLLGLLRTVAADVAAREGFSWDSIEDLRIAVSEAATFLLGSASPASRLTLRICPRPDSLDLDVSTDAPPGGWPPAAVRGSLAWHVLAALTDEVGLSDEESAPALHMTKRRATGPDGAGGAPA